MPLLSGCWFGRLAQLVKFHTLPSSHFQVPSLSLSDPPIQYQVSGSYGFTFVIRKSWISMLVTTARLPFRLSQKNFASFQEACVVDQMKQCSPSLWLCSSSLQDSTQNCFPFSSQLIKRQIEENIIKPSVLMVPHCALESVCCYQLCIATPCCAKSAASY